MTIEKKPDQNGSDPNNKPKKKRRLTMRAKVALVLAAMVALSLLAVLPERQTVHEQMARTTLDELTLSDLPAIPAAEFTDSARVDDYTIYGTSLVLYESAYQPLGRDVYFGRNVMLRNLATGTETRMAFTGGADGGIDLQDLPEGVYEVYVYDGYTPKRAYMNETFEAQPFITVRDDKHVKSIEMTADKDYLEKFGVQSDQNYLFLTVTETLPIAQVADVVIDPFDVLVQENGNVVEGWSSDSFSEAQASWDLARRMATYLENAGLRVVFSHEENTPAGYLGVDSRTGVAYVSQAKYFITLEMSDGDEARPFVMSSPFVNGLLGNDIVSALAANGIELEVRSTLDQLNPGNSYDLLSTDEEYQYTQFSLQPALRETGGKTTSAGLLDAWSSNSRYSEANGLNAVLFFYASAENPDSIAYYQEHVDAMARGLAQGVLRAASLDPALIDTPLSDSSGSASSAQAASSENKE